MKGRSRWWWIAGFGLSIGLLEVTLRFGLGLGNPPLMQADEATGYRFQPNQKLFRFGKFIEYNQYSQRNAPISPTKPPQTRRILMIGDSVLNGGVSLDQSEIITERFRSRLGDRVEVLNASAGSWGMENRIGYVREFGTFQSDVIIFQIGTSDLIQPTSTGAIVGVNPSFPNRPPASAIEEGWSRYLEPAIKQWLNFAWIAPARAETALTPAQNAAWFARNMKRFREEVRSLKSNPATRNVPVIVLYTPDRADVLPRARPPLYKAEFFRLLAQLKMPVVDVHKAWAGLPPETTDRYFMDGIHPTAAGSQAIAQLLFEQGCQRSKSAWCRP